MNLPDLAGEIAQKDFNLDDFIRLALTREDARAEIVHQMIRNPDIMVYYHCYYVVSKASHDRPDLFYSYWENFVQLLRHPNSYHRDFAITILANLTAVDEENRFDQVFESYFKCLNDPKMMTAMGCVRNAGKIILHKPELRERVVSILLHATIRWTYPEKQKALLYCDILEVLEGVYEGSPDQETIRRFILGASGSLSPKTRKKAKELIRKFGLN